MRHDTSAHLLGIPDLPEDAFKHIGDRRIKPQGLGKLLKNLTGGAIDVTGIDLSAPLKDIGIDLGKAKDWINDKVEHLIPGGWTTLGEVALSFTPLGVAGAAGLGALSGGTGGFRKKGFDLTGAIMGGLQGYGVGSLTQGLVGAGAPNPYDVGANYDITSATSPEAFNAPVADYGSGANYSLQSAGPVNSAGIAPTDYGLGSASGAAGSGTGLAGTSSAVGSFQSPGYGQYPTGGEIGLQGPDFGPSTVKPPSALESIGSGMADKASQAGQGIQNLVGAGPQGLSGIMPAASAVNASMGYTAYAGLGLVALEAAAKKNQDDHNQGKITDQQYLENQRMIDEAVANAKENVSKYPYQPEEGNYTQQETYYPRQGTTLYENKPVRYASSGGGLGSLYAQGGPVSDETPDTMMAGGITNGFRFASGGIAIPNLSKDVSQVGKLMAEKIAQIPAEQKAAEEKKQAELAKPMSQFTYSSDSSNPSSPTDYSNLGELLYRQKKLERGGYAQGGEARFLSGGGDGMSDSIKATIDGHQEARLADGEFVIPADVVSHLGNGSSKAGAKQLHAMMDRVRKARTGNPKQGKQINPVKFMPA